MITAQQSGKVTTNIKSDSTKEFVIRATKEAFRILSAGLYSDKIKAVIRELSTNAVDSHVEAGNPDRFDVHLPTYTEPWFSVKDYGTGMSDEKVKGLYSEYFGTDKNTTNDMIGCLGLGSKSPFSIVNQFTVTSIYDGVKRQYIVFINDKGTPSIDCVSEIKTDENNGVEIQVAVSTRDIYAYSATASSVYKYFDEDRIPNITSGSIDITKRDSVLSGEDGDWDIYGGLESIAIMGNVAYPINKDKITCVELKTSSMAILDSGIEIRFPNGDLQFTPSREHLSYDRSTCNALKKKLEIIEEELSKKIGEILESCQSLWQAKGLFNDMLYSTDSKLKSLRRISNLCSKKWRDKELGITSVDIADIDGVEVYKMSMDSYYSKSVRRNKISTLQARTSIKVFEDDIDRGSITRCSNYLKDTNNKCKALYLVKFDDDEAKAKFIDKLGMIPSDMLKTSSLPKPIYTKRSSNRRTLKNETLLYAPSASDSKNSYWSEHSVNLDDGGFYVEVNNYSPINPNSKCKSCKTHPNDPYQIINHIYNITGESISLIGVKTRCLKKFTKHNKWKELFSYSKELANKKYIGEGIYKLKADTEFVTQHFEYYQDLLSVANLVDIDSWKSKDIRELLRIVKEAQNVYRKNEILFQHLCALSYYHNLKVPSYTTDTTARELFEKIAVDFPVFGSIMEVRQLNRYYRSSLKSNVVKSILHYVNILERGN